MDVIQEIINQFQKELETTYFNLCLKSESDVVSFNSYSVNFCNERTIGHFCEDFIQNNFTKYKLIPVSLLNEFAIKMDFTAAKSLPDFSSEVSEAKDSIGIYYTPDSCFLVDDKIIYIEYKVMKSSFSYIKLASDYLKFKHYSHNSKKESWFIFVCLNENSLSLPVTPTILSPGLLEPKYQYINKIISRSSIDKTARVFIYSPKKGDESISPESSIDLLKQLDNMIDISSIFDVKESEKEFNSTKLLSDNIFYNWKGVFGSKVTTSYQIRRNYFEIKKLYDWYIQNHKKVTLTSKKEIDLSKDIMSQLEYDDFKQSSNYFKNQINGLNKERKNQINHISFNASYRKSLWIVLLLKKLAEDNNLPYFKDLKFEDENSKKDFEAIWSQLKGLYQDDYEFRFNSLCFELMMLIVNVVPFIYKLEDNHVTNKYSDEFIKSEKKQLLLNCYKHIAKILKIKDFDFLKDLNTDEFNKEILSRIVNL